MRLRRFEGKTAIITGSGRGLGASTALRLASEGCAIMINDLNGDNAAAVASQIKKAGARCAVSAHDISKREEAKALVEGTIAELGGLDILVNNAGITRDALLKKMTEEQFDDVIRVNLKGVFNCSQAAAEKMSEKNSGRIINLSSVSALGNVGQTNYSASKAAVIGMTRTMALELAKCNITVNTIAPGFFDSVLTQSIPAEVKTKLIQRIPLKRMGNPEELAALVAFLASDEAAYFTGQTFFIDGGLTAGVGLF